MAARIAWVLVLFGSLVPAAAQSDHDAWAGIWVANDGFEIQLWITLEMSEGRLTARVQQPDERAGSIPATVDVEGSTLTLVVEPLYEDDGEGGRIVLQRAADGRSLRVVRGRLWEARLRRLTLTRRDRLFRMSRSQALDMMHEDGDADGAGYMRASRAVSEALARAGRVLRNDREIDCASDLVTDAFNDGMAPDRIRVLTEAVLRAAGDRSICTVQLDELTLPDLSEPGVRCHRAIVQDSDGSTTVRSAPRGRSSSLGTLPNGTARRIWRMRGAWMQIAHAAREGWVHRSNMRCIR